jgi:hypothetical protein
MATLRTNLPDLFLSRLANLTDVLINEYEVEDQISEKILKVRDMGNRPFVTTTTVGTFGTVPIKVEGADVAYDEMGMGFDKTYTADTYELAFRTSKEALDDEQEESVSDAGRALGRSGRYTVEADCANIFNLGFSVTTGAPDGVVLFSTSHPLVGGGTQANRPSTDADLSTSALRSALNDIADTVDDGGLLIHWRPNVLLVPYELKWQADELMNSVDRSDTSDRAKNAFKSEGIQVIAWPYLTDADAWFLLDTSSLNIRKYWRERMNLLHDWDFESSGMKVKTRFRFVRGWSDFRGTYGTSGG